MRPGNTENGCWAGSCARCEDPVKWADLSPGPRDARHWEPGSVLGRGPTKQARPGGAGSGGSGITLASAGG